MGVREKLGAFDYSIPFRAMLGNSQGILVHVLGMHLTHGAHSQGPCVYSFS